MVRVGFQHLRQSTGRYLRYHSRSLLISWHVSLPLEQIADS
jgi:hypothetical protein